MVDDLKIRKYITFSEPVERVEDIYNSLDICVHSALGVEPFGRVIVEAMAMELTVISTNVGGPKEIISDGEDGYLIVQGDPKILADKIIYLIENPEVRRKIGKNASITVKNRFDIKITTKKIEMLYNAEVI